MFTFLCVDIGLSFSILRNPLHNSIYRRTHCIFCKWYITDKQSSLFYVGLHKGLTLKMILVVRNLLQNYCFSVSILTFYRRSFNEKNIPQFLCFLAEGIAIFVWGHHAAGAGILTIFVSLSTYIWRSNIKFRHSFPLVLFLLELENQLPVGVQLINSPVRAIVVQLGVSLTQFIRRPLSLKNKMRRLRVFMGPVYVLYSVRSFYLTYLDLGPVSPWVCTLSFASAVLACVGGVLFRPDNGLMLNVLLNRFDRKTEQFDGKIEHAQRKVIHRNCMILSGAISSLCLLYNLYNHFWARISY